MKILSCIILALLILFGQQQFASAQKNNSKPDTTKCFERTQLPIHYKTEMVKVVNDPAFRKDMDVPPAFLLSYDTIELESHAFSENNIPVVYETHVENIEVSPATTEWVITGFDTGCHSPNPDDCAIRQKQNFPAVIKQVMIHTSSVDKDQGDFKFTETKIIEVHEMMKGAMKKKVDVPANYSFVQTKTIVDPEAQYDNLEVLCSKKITLDFISALQRLLMLYGYTIDDPNGFAGHDTIKALTDFQKSNELPIGNFNLATLQYLGILP